MLVLNSGSGSHNEGSGDTLHQYREQVETQVDQWRQEISKLKMGDYVTISNKNIYIVILFYFIKRAYTIIRNVDCLLEDKIYDSFDELVFCCFMTS